MSTDSHGSSKPATDAASKHRLARNPLSVSIALCVNRTPHGRSSSRFRTSAKAGGRGDRSAWPTRSARRPARSCSTTRRTPRTTARSSRSPATPRRSRRAIARAVRARPSRSIDLRQHQGEHPRLGAVDVVPFVPIEGATMADCVALAREVGAAVADAVQRAGLPVRGGAARPGAPNLEDIRRGEFEGLAAKMASRTGRPTSGRRTPHPSAGASVDRRAHAAHRLQHQPRHRPARRREEDRRRGPAQHRRPPLREGDGRAARRPRHSCRCR